MELHLGVIDDPVKGRAEAGSRVIRVRTWNWFVDDFCTRFAANGALLMIMTRWHVDDLLGRFIERIPGVRALRFPAICERDDNYRRAGEPLFPERKPLDFLLEQRKLLTEGLWQALYQQSPIILGGGIFPIEKLKTLTVLDRSRILKSCAIWIKWDRGWWCIHCWRALHACVERQCLVIEHVVRGQWSALEREEKINSGPSAIARISPRRIRNRCRTRAWQCGNESAENTIRNLARFQGLRRQGYRLERSEGRAVRRAVQGGNVLMVAGIWQTTCSTRCLHFRTANIATRSTPAAARSTAWFQARSTTCSEAPLTDRRDQVDACSDAFNRFVAAMRRGVCTRRSRPARGAGMFWPIRFEISSPTR